MKNTFKAHFTFAFVTMILFCGQISNANPAYQKAPDWNISDWVVGPPTSLAALKGKVVIIDFFQLWCPGCNNFSIPLMNIWEKKYRSQKDDGKIEFVSIHTVFEGHNYQTNERLKKFVKEKNMHHPVGVDFLPKGSLLPTTMLRYNTRGTPEIAIIDKQGNIRFQQFGGFDPVPVGKLIDKLLVEDGES